MLKAWMNPQMSEAFGFEKKLIEKVKQKQSEKHVYQSLEHVRCQHMFLAFVFQLVMCAC